jgi:hypothetical protein
MHRCCMNNVIVQHSHVRDLCEDTTSYSVAAIQALDYIFCCIIQLEVLDMADFEKFEKFIYH